MKKINKLLLLIILFCLPLFVKAMTYSSAAGKAQSYMNDQHYKDNYQRYLYDGNSINLPFKYESGSISYDDEFASIAGIKPLGGLLNKEEFDLTKSDEANISSYLYDGKNYWTMSKSGSSHYMIGKDTYVSDTESGSYSARVTEFVQNETVVIGSGTRIDPWIFQPKYKVVATGINGSVSYPGGTQLVNKYGSIELALTAESGNDYVHNDCGFEQELGKDAAGKVNSITISGISKDIDCKVVFGLGLYKLDLVSTRNVEPKTIYAKYGEKFYSDSAGNIIFNELTVKPSETGYTFYGFDYITESSEKVKVIDSEGKVVLSSTSRITKDGFLIEDMRANQYTVNFDPNGGTVLPTSMQVTYKSEYGTLPIPTRDGYDFKGWFTSKDGETQIKGDSIVNILSTQTLYAHWEPGAYTLTYNAQGGSVSPSSKSITYGALYGELATPIKIGNTFTGWYDKASNGNQVTASTKVTTAASHTIYAYWNLNSYNCTAGSYLPANSVACSTCLAGYYCPGGTYTFSSTSNQGITVCPTGYTSAAGISSQNSCYMNVSAGYYVATSKASISSKCSAGTYKAAHTVNYGGTSSCSSCGSGQYSVAGSGSCSDCPVGYRDGGATTSQSYCIRNIPGGQYMATSGGTSNSYCPAGQYSSAHSVYYGNTSSCTYCSAGTYAPNAGSTSCTTCPSGQTSNAGASSCYNTTIRCRKQESNENCYVYHTGDPCAANCGRLTGCPGYCEMDNWCYYCSNWWDGCYNFSGYYEAYKNICETTTSYTDFTYNGSSCPYGSWAI